MITPISIKNLKNENILRGGNKKKKRKLRYY